MRLSLGYMNREQEMEVLSRPSAQAVLSQLNPVVTPEETAYVRTAYREVKVSDDVKNYLMDIVEATRMQGGFVSGCPPVVRWRCIRRRKPTRLCRAGTTLFRRTSRGWPRRCSAIVWSWAAA